MGFEPTTPAVTGQCSNQLSYRCKRVCYKVYVVIEDLLCTAPGRLAIKLFELSYHSKRVSKLSSSLGRKSFVSLLYMIL